MGKNGIDRASFAVFVVLLVVARHGAISAEQIFADLEAGHFRHDVDGHIVAGEIDAEKGSWRLVIELVPSGPVSFAYGKRLAVRAGIVAQKFNT